MIEPWRAVAGRLSEEPGGWLPEPLMMVGSHDLKGALRVWGVGVEVEYEVSDAWRSGSEMSRRVRIVPRYGLFAGADGDVVVEAAPGRSCVVRFVGDRTRSGSLLARPLDPLSSRLLVARFVDGVVGRLEEAASQRRSVIWPGDPLDG